MTEEKAQQSAENKPRTKKKFSLARVVVLFVIIFSAYCGLRYLEIKQAKKLIIKTESGKFDNIESEIFDLAEDYKNGVIGQEHHALSDIALSEVQEKGAEFIYKMLLKNQEQINELKQQNQVISAEFTKYKNQEKLGKIIVAYIDFRQKLLAGEAYDDALKNFEMLTVFDRNVQDKTAKLHSALKNFSTAKKLQKDFSTLIPEIIAVKNSDDSGGLFAKVRHSIAKLVMVRRIDGKNPHDVDGIIVKTEKALHDENYPEALGFLLGLDQKYHEILVDFLTELNAATEVKKLDHEILSYLKNLS